MADNIEEEEKFPGPLLFACWVVTVAFAVAGSLWGFITSTSILEAICSLLLGTVLWCLAVIYILDIVAYFKEPKFGEHGKLTYEMHAEIQRDFIIGFLTGLSLLLIYHLAHHTYDATAIDIGSLALPFLISSLVFCFASVRDANTLRNPARAKFVLLVLGAITILVGALIYGELEVIVEGRFSIARSEWLQSTMVMISVIIFMTTRKFTFSFNRGLSFYSPFGIGLSRPSTRRKQYEYLKGKLREEPFNLRAPSETEPSTPDRQGGY